MFDTLKKAWALASNSENIKHVLAATYNVVVKTSRALDVLAPELAIIPLTSPFAVYIPVIKLALSTIQKTIETFGPLVGFKTIVYAQENEDPKKALLSALDELKAAVENVK